MSYNFNLNDDFYSNNNKNKQPTNSNLNFAEMNTTSQFYDPNNTFQAPVQIQNQNFYSDWQQQPNYFNPAVQNDPYTQTGGIPNEFASQQTEFDQEPPLLEELGINFDHIYRKTKCVLNPLAKPHESIIHDEDLAGPLVFCIAYGFSLLLVGKIQFGYIYGITALGCLSMYSLLNLMSEKVVSAVCIGSTLGYCLLPMVILSFLSSVLSLQGFWELLYRFCLYYGAVYHQVNCLSMP